MREAFGVAEKGTPKALVIKDYKIDAKQKD